MKAIKKLLNSAFMCAIALSSYADSMAVTFNDVKGVAGDVWRGAGKVFDTVKPVVGEIWDEVGPVVKEAIKEAIIEIIVSSAKGKNDQRSTTGQLVDKTYLTQEISNNMDEEEVLEDLVAYLQGPDFKTKSGKVDVKKQRAFLSSKGMNNNDITKFLEGIN